jgi:hypothetical protein
MSLGTLRVGTHTKQVIDSIAYVQTKCVRSQRKRLLNPACPSVCLSFCPSFHIYRFHSLWKDFSEILTQGNFMEIWGATANLIKIL